MTNEQFLIAWENRKIAMDFAKWLIQHYHIPTFKVLTTIEMELLFKDFLDEYDPKP